MNGSQGTTERAEFMRRLPKNDVDTHEADYKGFHVVFQRSPEGAEGSALMVALRHIKSGLITGVYSTRRAGFASYAEAANAAADFIDERREHYDRLASSVTEVPV